jgi:hypothetical protein
MVDELTAGPDNPGSGWVLALQDNVKIPIYDYSLTLCGAAARSCKNFPGAFGQLAQEQPLPLSTGCHPSPDESSWHYAGVVSDQEIAGP